MNSKQIRARDHALRLAIKRGDISILLAGIETKIATELPQQIQVSPTEEGSKRGKQILAGLGVLAAILGVWAFGDDYLPRVSVEASSPIRDYLPKGTFMSKELNFKSVPSSTFTTTNNSKYSIQDVKSSCWNSKASFLQEDDVWNGEARDSKTGEPVGPEVATNGTSDLLPTLRPGDHQPFQCTLRYREYDSDPLHRKIPPSWAQVEIVVEYKFLWILPLKRRFRFTTESSKDGTANWLPSPI